MPPLASNSPQQPETGLPRVNVQGIGVSAIDYTMALEEIDRRIREDDKGYVVVGGVNGVILAQRDEQLRQVYQNACMITPDGMPLVWYGRLTGFPKIRRVYGPDLMLKACEAGVARGWTHYLFGSHSGATSALQENLERWHPGVKIVGRREPPFRPLTEEENQELAAEIAALKPDIIWVSLGVPKQDRFIAEYLPLLQTKVMIGVGAAFDFHAGRVKQAPVWMRNSGFEWLFRLCAEPRRLWKRYFYTNSLFIWQTFLQALRLKRWKLPPTPPDCR